MKHLLWAGLLLVFGAHAIAAIALNATDVSAVVAFAHATWNCDGRLRFE